jgi:chromosome segregation ATPase
MSGACHQSTQTFGRVARRFLIKDSEDMAKAATKKTVKSATKAVKPGRRAAAAKPTKSVKAVAPAKKPAAARAPVVSKDELRAQLEKAQTTITTLRTKSREATRAAKEAAARIAELEAKVAQLEKTSSAKEKPTSAAPSAEKPVKPRGRRALVKAAPDAPIEPAEPVLADSETPEE